VNKSKRSVEFISGAATARKSGGDREAAAAAAAAEFIFARLL
jgi:hypothetical protein